RRTRSVSSGTSGVRAADPRRNRRPPGPAGAAAAGARPGAGPGRARWFSLALFGGAVREAGQRATRGAAGLEAPLGGLPRSEVAVVAHIGPDAVGPAAGDGHVPAIDDRVAGVHRERYRPARLRAEDR